MIQTKSELKAYIRQDALANGRKSEKSKVFGDEIWKYQLLLRKLEYFSNRKRIDKGLHIYVQYAFAKCCLHHLSLKLGFSIPINVFGPGLSIPHHGTIVVANAARVGKNCRLHEGVTIGATNGNHAAAIIGDNVFIGTGAKIIGDITIADDVAIGANAVVTKSIKEPGTTWGGIPAKMISQRSSHDNLRKELFNQKC